MSHSLKLQRSGERTVYIDISKTQKFKEIYIYIYVSSNIFMQIKNQRLLVSPFAQDQTYLPQRRKRLSLKILLSSLYSGLPSGETSREDPKSGQELQ